MHIWSPYQFHTLLRSLGEHLMCAQSKFGQLLQTLAIFCLFLCSARNHQVPWALCLCWARLLLLIHWSLGSAKAAQWGRGGEASLPFCVLLCHGWGDKRRRLAHIPILKNIILNNFSLSNLKYPSLFLLLPYDLNLSPVGNWVGRQML